MTPTINQIITSRVQMGKRRDGGWDTPKLRLSVVTGVDEENSIIDVADLLIPMPTGDSINLPHGTKGLHQLVLPACIKKTIGKEGKLFERQRVRDEDGYQGAVREPQFQKDVGGSYVNVPTLDECDRIIVYLKCNFSTLISNINAVTRLAQVRDNNVDGGWRAATPWTQDTPRQFRLDDGTLKEYEIRHLSRTVTAPITLDRPARLIEAAVTAEVGESID